MKKIILLPLLVFLISCNGNDPENGGKFVFENSSWQFLYNTQTPERPNYHAHFFTFNTDHTITPAEQKLPPESYSHTNWDKNGNNLSFSLRKYFTYIDSKGDTKIDFNIYDWIEYIGTLNEKTFTGKCYIEIYSDGKLIDSESYPAKAEVID